MAKEEFEALIAKEFASKTPVANITPFGLRMQPEMKDRVDASARSNNRSINSEIVERLDWSFFGGPKEIEYLQQRLAEQQGRIGELQATLEAEREQAERLRDRHTEYRIQIEKELGDARHSAEVASAFRDDMAYMSNMLRQMHEEDRATLEELDSVVHFLEADRVRLEARVIEERIIPRTQDGPGPLKSRLAQRFAWAIDQRMGLMARLFSKLGAPEPATRRAHVAMHEVELSSFARELAEIYADEGSGNAEAFYDYASGLIEGMPDDRQPEYRSGLKKVMPRLFPEWKSDDHPLFD